MISLSVQFLVITFYPGIHRCVDVDGKICRDCSRLCEEEVVGENSEESRKGRNALQA